MLREQSEQVQKWLEGAYQYQAGEAQRQSQFNTGSMLKQMGYNTLGAIQGNMKSQQKFNRRSMFEQMGYNTMAAITQGVYNQISNNAAMSYNSAEAAKNRAWQKQMSDTAYQRAVADMKKAGINPILAYQQGGASTPGGAQGTISGASMGLASSSAASASALGVSQNHNNTLIIS